MTDIWSDALQGLQPRLGAQTYDLWLRPIALRQVAGTRLHLTAPNRFMKEWFENHYLGAVLDELKARTAQQYDVEIEVDATTETRPAEPAAAKPTAPAILQSRPPEPQHLPQLSGRYRFQNFIQGAANELAASAAWAAAQEPGTRFNPLFIYGGVGLGKTHLLHAIGHHIHATRPGQRIVYQSAERFMNEFIAAVRQNQFDAFRTRYREHCDVLLIDDIQFIAGRDRTMDEFFHVFNALYEAEKQIVVTSDRMPSEMQGMEDRLISRLNWGLVADVKLPDLETRVAILRQKAEAGPHPDRRRRHPPPGEHRPLQRARARGLPRPRLDLRGAAPRPHLPRVRDRGPRRPRAYRAAAAHQHRERCRRPSPATSPSASPTSRARVVTRASHAPA
jgi:chromosomal replication initiator protein